MIDLETAISRETRRPTAEAMDAIRERAERCVRQMEEYGVAENAALARRIRHCRWPGQHWSERVWDTAGEAAYPFDGASDFRRRDADFLANQRVAEAFTALMRARWRFGRPGGSSAEAAWAAREWEDARRRRMGAEWTFQNLLLANYLHGCGRAVAGLWTGWRRDRELRPRRRPLSYVGEAWAAAQAAQGLDAAAALEEFSAAAAAPGAEAFLADALESLGLCRAKAEAREGAASLVAAGWFEEVAPATVADRPSVKALALGDTLWVPVDTPVGAGDDADEMHLVEWMDRATLLSRARLGGWDPSFVRELAGSGGGDLGHEGESVFPLYEWVEDAGGVSRADASRLRGLYQVVRSYVRGVSADGSIGRYEVVWAPGARGLSADGLRLVRDAHGRWPVQIYTAEVAGPFALDARSLPVLASGVQEQGKISFDTMANISMLQLSPVVTKGRREQGQLLIEPLGEIRLGATGDARFLTPPQVPGATIAWQDRVDRWRDLYFGIPNKDLPPQLWQNQQSLRVWLQLAQSAETCRRVLAACATEAPSETLPPALAADPGAAWDLPVEIACDPHEWDLEYIEKTAQVVNSLLMPMDRKGVLRTSELVGDLLLSMLPEHASALAPEEEADDAELRDEQRNLMLVRAGVRPKVPEGGSADYAGRLRMYEDMLARNPAAFDDMGPDKRQLLEEHMAALRQQLTQYGENRDIGRYGARREVPAPEEA